MKRVIIAGSPRSNGRSAHLAEMLFEANIDECPEDEIYLVPVSELEISPCIACGACKAKTEYTVVDEKSGEEEVVTGHVCVLDDDMADVYPLIDAADELTVVSPVFFSGSPAPLKALLDRLQPYFWASREKDLATRLAEKRPLTLHVIGEGGDPHGYDPLVSEVRSATAIAGFKLERILDWVGKIDENGEIIAEAEVVEGTLRHEEPTSEPQAKQATQQKPRPKLDLSSGSGKQNSQQAKQKGRQQQKPQGKQQAKSQGKQQTRAQGKQQSTQQSKGKRRG